MERKSDYFDNTKLKYTSRGLFFTVVALFFLTIFNIYLNDDDIYILGFGFCAALASYVYIRKTRELVLPGYALITLGYFLVTYSLITSYRYENIIDVFWILNLAIVAFYLLGKRVGLIFLIISTTTLVVVKTLTMKGIIVHDLQDIGAFNSIDFIINVIICTSLLAYLFIQIISINNEAQKELIITNEQIQEQNDEKTIMLKEIHHRVKNNLQVITSLLRLQLFRLDDEKIIALFQESINRISTMALIHAKMYQGDSINNLNLKSYIQDLATDLIRTNATQQHISVQVQSTVNELDLTNLVPFSLIINELITNSIKHGFKQKKTGQISIDVKRLDTYVALVYQDDGQWQTPIHDNSFGLELITTLTEQFSGSFEIDTNQGTQFTFELYID